MKLKDYVSLLTAGGPGFVQLAVTNACNAQCRFCNFSRLVPANWQMADFSRLRSGLAALAAGGVRFVAFTGGEPLLYPELLPALTTARDLGLTTLLCTNGWLLTPARITAFAKAGLEYLIISLDAASEAAHDAHRGLPGLVARIRRQLPVIRDAGITPVASVTLSRLIPDFDCLGEFLVELGFNRVTFSYPLTRLHSGYLSYAAEPLVTFTPAEFHDLLGRLLDWRRRAPVRVLNPSLSLQEIRRQLRGQPGRFPCLAGDRYFFVDWQLRVYRCHYLSQVLGRLEDFPTLPRLRDHCQACFIDCYRDASVQQYLAVSLARAWQAGRRGHWRQAGRALFDPRNLLALAAVLETRFWWPHG